MKAPALPLRAALLEAIRPYEAVEFWLPAEEEPVALEEALRWLDESSRKGIDLDFRVDPDGDSASVWLLPRTDEIPEIDLPGYLPEREE